MVRGSRRWRFRAQTTPQIDRIRGAQKRCSGDQPDVARVDEGLDELAGHTRRARDLFCSEDVLKDLGHEYRCEANPLPHSFGRFGRKLIGKTGLVARTMDDRVSSERAGSR